MYVLAIAVVWRPFLVSLCVSNTYCCGCDVSRAHSSPCGECWSEGRGDGDDDDAFSCRGVPVRGRLQRPRPPARSRLSCPRYLYGGAHSYKT